MTQNQRFLGDVIVSGSLLYLVTEDQVTPIPLESIRELYVPAGDDGSIPDSKTIAFILEDNPPRPYFARLHKGKKLTVTELTEMMGVEPSKDGKCYSFRRRLCM